MSQGHRGWDGGGQQSTKENRRETASDLPKDGPEREGVSIVKDIHHLICVLT